MRTGLPRLAFGDEFSEALIPVAQQLVRAVHDGKRTAVGDAFAEAMRLSGERQVPDVVTRVANRLRVLEHLAVVLAAMVVEDQPSEHLLGWTADPAKYCAMRTEGTPALLASILCLPERLPPAAGGGG